MSGSVKTKPRTKGDKHIAGSRYLAALELREMQLDAQRWKETSAPIRDMSEACQSYLRTFAGRSNIE
jgi:hypothetical protein